MKAILTHPSRIILAGFGILGMIWLMYNEFVSAQSIQPLPPARVLNLKSAMGVGDASGTSPIEFLSMRANDSGLFIWAEEGESHRAGARAATVYQISENGALLRSTPLPAGARLTVTNDFGLDSAGNIYFFQARRGEATPVEHVVLVKVDPRGEVVEEFPLSVWPDTFTVGNKARVSLLTMEAEVIAPDAPGTPIARGRPPYSEPDQPPRWAPLLEELPGGKLVLVDGVTATFQVLSEQSPEELRTIKSPELQASLRHLQQVHGAQTTAPIDRVEMVLRGSCTDERGQISFTLMGTRPSQGIVVVRIDGDGNALPSLRLEAPMDANRPQIAGRPRSEGDASLMFPYDLALWRDKAFVLGVHGLVAVYEGF